MNEYDPFEHELRKARPASLPPELKRRFQALRPEPAPVRRTNLNNPAVDELWRRFGRYVLPLTAGVVLGLIVWQASVQTTSRSGPGIPGSTAAESLKADDVEVESELVSVFDAVGKLPGGEPVRFHCREWVDQVTWEDKRHGVVVEKRTPRFEVVPVRFETD